VTLKAAFAKRLRYLADRIDHAGAPKSMGWSFTYELGEGIRFRDDDKGCRLWYLGDADHDRAHTEADKRAPWIDWATMALKPYPVVPRERVVNRDKEA
jgi:hypothetical protein